VSGKEILHLASRGVRDLLGCTGLAVYLLTKDGKRLRMIHRGLPKALERLVEGMLKKPIPPVRIRLKPGGIHWHALRANEPLVVDEPDRIQDLMREHAPNTALRALVPAIFPSLGIASVLVVPLECREGHFGLASISRKTPFSVDDIHRLQTVCAQLALILQRERAERERDELAARNALLLEGHDTGLLGLDHQGRILFANRVCRAHLGWSPKDMLGRSAHKLLHNKTPQGEPIPELDCAILAALARKERMLQRREVLWRRSGSSFEALLNYEPSTGGDDRLAGLLSFREAAREGRGERRLKRQLTQLRRNFGGTVQALFALSERRDPFTARHQQRMAALARRLAQRLALHPERVDAIRLAATLHDIGKFAIPHEILNKSSALNQAEWDLIRTHSSVGWEVLKNGQLPPQVALAVRQHHERMDGTGYPDGLKGDAICLEARILAVTDTVEAMTSLRPYRPAHSPEKALAEIRRGRGTKYDEAVADACLGLFKDKGLRPDQS